MVKSYKTVVFIQLFSIYTIVRIWEYIYFIQISYSLSFTISRWRWLKSPFINTHLNRVCIIYFKLVTDCVIGTIEYKNPGSRCVKRTSRSRYRSEEHTSELQSL